MGGCEGCVLLGYFSTLHVYEGKVMHYVCVCGWMGGWVPLYMCAYVYLHVSVCTCIFVYTMSSE